MALCRLNQLLRRAGEQDLPVVDDHQPVTHRLHVLDNVGGQQYQPVLGRAGEQVAEVDALLRVQPHRRLIEDQEGRGAQQGLGDAHPLALSAGQAADAGAGLPLQIDRPDHLADGCSGVPQPLQGGHIVQELGHGELVEQPEVLGKIAQLGLQLPLRLEKGLSVHQNGAGCGEQGGHQQLHQSGLARAVWPQQADEAGRPELQTQVLQGLFSAGVGHADVLNVDFHVIGILSAWDTERIPWLCGGELEIMCGLCGEADTGKYLAKSPPQNTSVLRRTRFLPYRLAEQSGMQGIEFVQTLGQRLWVFFIHNMAGMFDKL